MAQDAADKAHQNKVEKTADGERLVEHSTFTEGDRELRTLQDEAEVARQDAYRETGYVAGPLTGDYHAVRREAKQAGALLAGIGGQGTVDDPSAMALQAGVGDVIKADVKAAGQARRAAGADRRQGPQGRSTRSEAMGVGVGGTTGGLQQGSAEGSGKSASSTGTDTTDRGMDASVGDQPANPQLEGIDPKGQERPTSAPGQSGKATGKSTSGGTGSTRRS